MIKLPVALAVAGALFATCAVAQLPRDADVPPGQLATRDLAYLQDADAANVAQLTLGNAAATIAVDPGVHSLANSVVSSYKKAIQGMNLLAGAKHVDMANKPTPVQQTEIDDLVAHHGAEADSMYVHDVARDSDDLISFYLDMRENAIDPDIRAYADTMLPAVRENRRSATDMLKAKNM